jgi:hypothetical protein
LIAGALWLQQTVLGLALDYSVHFLKSLKYCDGKITRVAARADNRIKTPSILNLNHS